MGRPVVTLLVAAAMADEPTPPVGDLHPPAAASRFAFNRDVRPILSAACFQCHGPDQHAARPTCGSTCATMPWPIVADMRRSCRASPMRAALVTRIHSSDPDERMPPAASHRELSAAQIETLTRWVEQGAEYEPHWSLVAPERPEVPEVCAAAWVRNGIDSFILSRLEQEGLRPSPEAGRETLLRRVTLDLTGLPPAIDEIDAFLLDNRPDSYERVVDRLLASTRYGERMAVPWLDAARYADTHGYQDDGVRHMWRWRDWVIDALNLNMPFDRFTVEQLAGDLLPDAQTDQTHCHGIQPQSSRQLRRRDHSRGVSRGVRRRSCRDDCHGVAGYDDGLRPLPRS